MSIVTGGKTVIGAYDETAYKTAGTSGIRLPFSQFTLKRDQGRDADPVMSGYMGNARGVLGLKSVAGNIASSLAPESIGFWLKHLIGTPTSATAGSAYKHTFLVGSASDIPPGITFEQDFGSAFGGTHRCLKFIGCRINQGTLNFGQSGVIPVSFDILGADMVPASTPIDATLTDLGHTGWSATNLGIVLSNGSTIDACIRSLSCVHTNDLDAEQYCLSAGGIRDDLPRGFVGANGQAVALFDSQDLLEQTLADTDASIVVTVQRGTGAGTAGNEKLVLTYPAITFAPAGVPVTGPKGLQLTADWSCHRTTGEIGIKAELWNAQATIVT